MTTPVTDADVLRILSDMADRHPNMRLRNALYNVEKRRKAAEMREAMKRAARPSVAERGPLDMPVAKRVMEIFGRFKR